MLFDEKYSLKTSAIPGLTAHSRCPSMMKAIGLDFTVLLDRLIELGVGE